MTKQKITGQAQAHNGEIDYQIEVQDQKITDFKITHHSETKGIFDQVIDQIKAEVLNQQTFAVDTISSATVMSQTLLDSAQEQLAHNNLQITPRTTAPAVPENKKITTEVLIIGGGEAGLVAIVKL
ncbi:FMN-binding protein [Bombilactobacillus apium]|uniref:FMN-binding protein n=1 Tax=Bombilactobacillus apium TaxID=2675299 RepID=UPI001E441325|nr:FMN-binding protein [Bombilactobacillus apium]